MKVATEQLTFVEAVEAVIDRCIETGHAPSEVVGEFIGALNDEAKVEAMRRGLAKAAGDAFSQDRSPRKTAAVGSRKGEHRLDGRNPRVREDVLGMPLWVGGSLKPILQMEAADAEQLLAEAAGMAEGWARRADCWRALLEEFKERPRCKVVEDLPQKVLDSLRVEFEGAWS